LKAATTPRELALGLVQRYNQPLPPGEPFTIAALDMAKLPDLRMKTNALAEQLLAALDADPAAESEIRAAYAAAQKFDYDSSFTIDQGTDAYVDLADFALKLHDHNLPSEVLKAADEVAAAVGGRGETERVVLDRPQIVSGAPWWALQPWPLDDAHGLAIYLPLGERDCRPTGAIGGPDDPTCVPTGLPASNADPAVEHQLNYYAHPGQLAFTTDPTAPDQITAWAQLLLRLGLDEDTPRRDLGARPYTVPVPSQSLERTYLPILVRL
jgi:hypothetical protein